MPYSESQLNDQTQHHWSVKLFDRPDGLADRNAHFAKHKARLAQFKKDNPGVIGEWPSGYGLRVCDPVGQADRSLLTADKSLADRCWTHNRISRSGPYSC